ncbi:CAP domain-containing protein, partial [Pyronema domesticum]
RAHNTYRKQHGTKPLKWDPALERSAQAWASSCKQQHDLTLVPKRIGDCLAWGQPSPTSAVDWWVAERARYNYATGDFAMGTGHFTAVVWRDTQRVGCGAAKCNNQW